MGRRVLEACAGAGDIDIVAAWVGDQSEWRDTQVHAGDGLRYQTLGVATRRPDVVIDFSRADAFDDVLAWCLREHVALVTGTTGLSPAQHRSMADAGATVPVLWSSNFSPGVAVLNHLVKEASRALSGWDVEIAEAHHASKVDAPSGTALSLGRTVAGARNQSFDEQAAFDRHGTNRPREPGQIGFSVIRAADIVGEHTVLLATTGERLELTHRASDRLVFAHGAVHAARWLAGRSPGRYSFGDSLIQG